MEACGLDEAPRYLLRDRDSIYGEAFCRQAGALEIGAVTSARRAPWQNASAERIIGCIRRERLDHAIILRERHLKRALSSYADDYHTVRTHLLLKKDSPDGRTIQLPGQGKVVELKRVGGLHNQYVRRAV